MKDCGRESQYRGKEGGEGRTDLDGGDGGAVVAREEGLREE